VVNDKLHHKMMQIHTMNKFHTWQGSARRRKAETRSFGTVLNPSWTHNNKIQLSKYATLRYSHSVQQISLWFSTVRTVTNL